MAAAAVPLPRKISTSSEVFKAALRGAHVNPICTRIWELGKAGGRTDTFIGIINSTDWTFYLAPCFGLAPGAVKGTGAGDVAAKIAAGNFPGETEVMANSTSGADTTMLKISKTDLEACYGADNVCYTELHPDKGFDGMSHKALSRWIRLHHAALKAGADFWSKALGFAIQRDKDGYYIRFASTLNLHPGQLGAGGAVTFAKKQVLEQVYICCCIPWGMRTVDVARAVEARDLPYEWSCFVEDILCRDLKLGIIRREKIVSRGEGLPSRMTRVAPVAPPAPRPDLSGDFKSSSILI